MAPLALQMQPAKVIFARTKSASIQNPFASPLAHLDKHVKLVNAPSALDFRVKTIWIAILNTARTVLASLSHLKIATPMTTALTVSASITCAIVNPRIVTLYANPVRLVIVPLVKTIPELFASKMTIVSPVSVQKTSANSLMMPSATSTTTAYPAYASDTRAENLPILARLNVKKIRLALTTFAKVLTEHSAKQTTTVLMTSALMVFAKV